VLRAPRGAAQLDFVLPHGTSDALPTIGLPLRATDPDISFDIQQPIDLLFERRRFAERLDYSRELVLPLAG